MQGLQPQCMKGQNTLARELHRIGLRGLRKIDQREPGTGRPETGRPGTGRPGTERPGIDCPER